MIYTIVTIEINVTETQKYIWNVIVWKMGEQKHFTRNNAFVQREGLLYESWVWLRYWLMSLLSITMVTVFQ